VHRVAGGQSLRGGTIRSYAFRAGGATLSLTMMILPDGRIEQYVVERAHDPGGRRTHDLRIKKASVPPSPGRCNLLAPRDFCDTCILRSSDLSGSRRWGR